MLLFSTILEIDKKLTKDDFINLAYIIHGYAV